MKPEWRRFAPLGLYLSILAVLVSAGLYIVQRQWNLPLQISLGLIVVGLALFALLDPERTRRIFTGRQARYGSNALVLSIAFIGILVVVNYLVYQNSQRWDLTEDKEFTLAPETIQTLERMTGDVTAQAFFSANTSSETARSLLDQYAFHSKGKFHFAFIDPYQDPVAAETAKITRDGSIVLTMNGNQQIVENVSEQELTGAMVRLLNPVIRNVYFLTGHGEFDPQGTGEEAYSTAARVLESKNYTVQTLSLLSTNAVPQDAKVVVIAGPQQSLQAAEVDLLSEFLNNGGAVMVMSEPTVMTQMGDSTDLLQGLLTEWGVKLGNDFILDDATQSGAVAAGIQYGSHPIVTSLQGIYTLMPSARSVSVGEASNGASGQVIVSTGPQAWGETDMTALQAAFQQQQATIAPDQGSEIVGSVPIAVAVENFETNGRLVVMGDSEFASDRNFMSYANGDLFTNSVDWLAGEEDLIALTPKESTTRLLVPPTSVSMNLILLGMVFVLPGLALFSGLAVFIQRRRRG